MMPDLRDAINNNDVYICTGGDHDQINGLDYYVSTIEIMIVFETNTRR